MLRFTWNYQIYQLHSNTHNIHPLPPDCHTPWHPQELEKLRPMAMATAEVEQRATSAEEQRAAG